MPSSGSKKENRKKKRKVEHLETIPYRYYIFCEGIQTEPLYFKGFEKAIKNNSIYKNSIHIETIGVGKETLRIINEAEKYVEKNNIRNSEIWCVYDKDSFPEDDFNAVSHRAEALNNTQGDVKYHVAWSNQCIEYWFILHFAKYDSDNDRKYYREFLHKKFFELGWERYEKKNEELFNILTNQGNPKAAIKRAEERLTECKGLPDSKSAPATKVHLLVKELARFLPDELRIKYL